jgi:hypothetical protein
MEIDRYSANYWYLTVSAFGNGETQCTQILEPINSGDSYRLKRIIRKTGGTYPWEWENPPVVPLNINNGSPMDSIHYRTTERWNGKPVYTCAALFSTGGSSGSDTD